MRKLDLKNLMLLEGDCYQFVYYNNDLYTPNLKIKFSDCFTDELNSLMKEFSDVKRIYEFKISNVYSGDKNNLRYILLYRAYRMYIGINDYIFSNNYKDNLIWESKESIKDKIKLEADNLKRDIKRHENNIQELFIKLNSYKD